jgi:nucleotide-binding universal stress UspA family protein
MYRKLLTAVADHPASRAAIDEAIRLASTERAEILFAHVLHRHLVAVTDMPPVAALAPEEFAREAANLADRLLAEATAAATAAGVQAHSIAVTAADDADGLCDLAREQACDLIVVGCERGNALTRLLTGSVVPGLITRSPVPVLVCRDHSQPQPKAHAGSAEANKPRATTADPSTGL